MAGVSTNINIPQSAFIDPLTGRPAREWQVWLQYPRMVGAQFNNPLQTGSGGTGNYVTPTDGQVLIGNGTGYEVNTLTSGTGIDIANGSGEITIGLATPAPGQPSSITVGASPFTYTNTLKYNSDVLISGGGISKLLFTRNGTTFYNTGSYYGMFTLSPNDSLKVYYVSAPTMTLIPR